MVDNLSVALLQYDIVWENPQANIEKINQLLFSLPENVKLIVLPEMFLTGFSMNVEKCSQTMTGDGVKWICHTAVTKNAIVMGSLPIFDNGKYTNRLVISKPDGTVQYYDKRHLFRMGEENSIFSSGNKNILVDCEGVSIRPLICYDLRFPVWSRNVNQAYDILIYVTNWPSVRRDAYLSLLKARAIENQCFVIGVNRIGTDGNGLKYDGDSIIFDAKGSCIVSSNMEEVVCASLSISELRKFKEKFPVYLDADEFVIKF